MTPLHGGAALLVAGAAKVASDHSIAAAVIVAAGGLLTLVVGQITAELIRRARKPPIDHHAEVCAEQAELVDHLLAELADVRGDRNDLENEVKRLKRGRRG